MSVTCNDSLCTIGIMKHRQPFTLVSTHLSSVAPACIRYSVSSLVFACTMVFGSFLLQRPTDSYDGCVCRVSAFRRIMDCYLNLDNLYLKVAILGLGR